jgi:hypothetical protein
MTDAKTTDRDGSNDFDFQTGRWQIHNQRLKERLKGCTEWETFEATQEARLLPGLGNIDDFVTDHWPGFVGLSLRLYNPRTRKWSIYWGSTRTDGLEPPVVGSFDANGVGIFEGRQQLDGQPILVRFTWSRITKNGAPWEQDFSPDDGKTWEKNWIMTMTRID